MKQYFPMAVALYDKSKPQQLFTYDSCLSIVKCNDIFKVWQNDYGYILLSTWIEVLEDGDKDIVNHKCLVNALGQVTRI